VLSSSRNDTLIEVCRARAAERPDAAVYTYLRDGEEPAATLTFAELDRRARALAVELGRHAGPGDRALVHLPQGLDFLVAFFGCLYAGLVAVPTAPPEAGPAGSVSARRNAGIARNAGPVVVVSTTALLAGFPPGPARVAIDGVDSRLARDWRRPAVGAQSLAYLQYSSGSTGSPKGVALSHGNVLHNMTSIRDLCEVDERLRVATWLPLFHDMGLISALQGVLIGCHVTLMSPTAFVKHPIRWLRRLSGPEPSGTAAPNFAYDLCVSRITDGQKAELDLSGLHAALVGAERVRPDTLRRFSTAFAPCGFRPEAFLPCYGLAESTLMVTGGPLRRPPEARRFALDALARGSATPAADGDVVELVACGEPGRDLTVVVADPDTLTPCPDGRIGEIFVAGQSVATGYWNAPDETVRAFGVTLDGVDGDFLRTGDVGTFVDGQLYVTGRRKDLVIVDGVNHHPADVEATAEAAHPAIRRGCCAVVSVDHGDRETAVILAELTSRAVRTGDGVRGIRGVAEVVRRAVSARHGLPVHDVVLLPPGSLPFTTSGKLQHYACRLGYAAGAFERNRLRDEVAA